MKLPSLKLKMVKYWQFHTVQPSIFFMDKELEQYFILVNHKLAQFA